MKQKETKLVSVIAHLMKENINESSIDFLYEDLDIFNIYCSGLCCSSLENNLNVYYENACEKYNRIKDILNQLTEYDIEAIDELHFELYDVIFQKHQEDVDKRICHYIETGEFSCLPEMFKKTYNYSWNTTKDLIELYHEKYRKQFTSIDEVFDFCEEEEIDM